MGSPQMPTLRLGERDIVLAGLFTETLTEGLQNSAAEQMTAALLWRFTELVRPLRQNITQCSEEQSILEPTATLCRFLMSSWHSL